MQVKCQGSGVLMKWGEIEESNAERTLDGESRGGRKEEKNLYIVKAKVTETKEEETTDRQVRGRDSCMEVNKVEQQFIQREELSLRGGGIP